MNISGRLRRLFRNPPGEIVRRVNAFGVRRWREVRQQMRDRFSSTYPRDRSVLRQPLEQLIPALTLEALAAWRDVLVADAEKILQHRFSFLGAQQVQVGQDLQPAGLEGHRYAMRGQADVNLANQRHAARLRRMISSSYRPLDWQVDIRSGYRWKVTAPYSSTVYGTLPGVDVKLPWELARMQHAPRLALAAATYRLSGDNKGADRLRIEYQDQVLDFIAGNPPRFGVNWACTMDVAIRIANLLIARDIFIAAGMRFSSEFDFEFTRSVMAHGHHIVTNLEWFADLRSNHYLSNVAGLLFVAAYLPSSPETDAWLAFAANELGKELFAQFQADGSSFEGSTSYHRLSGEMAVFSVALAHRVATRLNSLDLTIVGHGFGGAIRVPPVAERTVRARHELTSLEVECHLARIMNFSRAITRPDGGVVQIGDNDSGHFFNLTPIMAADGPQQADNHAILIECIERLCVARKLQPKSLDALLVSYFAGHTKDIGEETVQRRPAKGDGLSSFDDFGLYVFRRPRLWLSLRCGSVGQWGNGGHAHNDQLSVEACFDGVAFLVDPGTYVYTPLPEQRNAFRSTQAHATLVAFPGEQNGWLEGNVGLFSLTRVAATRVVEATPTRFVGEHDGFSATHRRTVTLAENGFNVIDECDACERLLVFPLTHDVVVEPDSGGFLLKAGGVSVRLRISGGVPTLEEGAFSPGYGRKVKTRVIRVRDIPSTCHWSMCLQEAGCD